MMSGEEAGSSEQGHQCWSGKRDVQIRGGANPTVWPCRSCLHALQRAPQSTTMRGAAAREGGSSGWRQVHNQNKKGPLG